MYKINYIYEEDQDGNKMLLGANIWQSQKGSKTVYIGLPFDILDIENEINATLFKVDNERLRQKFEESNAFGIVYFPQIDGYRFFGDNDEVIIWSNEFDLKKTLDSVLFDLLEEQTLVRSK